jgi:uncharacterized spore protein YtfJ
MALNPEIGNRVEAGGPLVAGGRTIYPVANASAFGVGDKVLGGWLLPLALVVIESKRAYLIPFSRNLTTLDEVLELAPSLRPMVDKARGIHRIKVL